MNKALYFAGFLCLCLLINALNTEIFDHKIFNSHQNLQSIDNEESYLPLQSDNNEVLQNLNFNHKPVKGDKSKVLFLTNHFESFFFKQIKQVIVLTCYYHISLPARAP